MLTNIDAKLQHLSSIIVLNLNEFQPGSICPPDRPPKRPLCYFMSIYVIVDKFLTWIQIHLGPGLAADPAQDPGTVQLYNIICVFMVRMYVSINSRGTK